MRIAPDIEKLLLSLGFRAKTGLYYEMALTHSSVNGEKNSHNQDYERLEFLGDSLIGFVTSELCYTYHPEMEEGELSSLKSNFIKTDSEALYAKKIGLDKLIRVGPSFHEDLSKDHSLLEDVFESFIGALVLDQGKDVAYAFTRSLFEKDIPAANVEEINNPKSELQEAMQAESRESVHYKTLKEEGPSNARIFTCAVYFEDEELGEGVGNSKKDAETKAARSALTKMAGSTSLGGSPEQAFLLLRQENPPLFASEETKERCAFLSQQGQGPFVDEAKRPLPSIETLLSRGNGAEEKE
jgi:ribonuclease-3